MKNKLPVGALRLAEHEDGNIACCFAEGEAKKLKMQIYSGKPITDHWYWGSLVIDLDGMSAQGSKFPILEDHMTDKKIGFTAKPIVTDRHALQVDPEKTVFLDTIESENFQKHSAKGFPYQASVRGTPTEIQRLGEKEVAQVNGYEFKGPGFIWRKWDFKEGSVTVFGADSKTQSSTFAEKEDVDIEVIGELPESFKSKEQTEGPSETGEQIIIRAKRKENGMELKDATLTQLKEERPELFKEIQDEASQAKATELEDKFAEERKTFEDKEKDLSAKVDKFSTIVGEVQKENALSKEKSMKKDAEYAFDTALSESNVVDRLHDKVKAMVRYTDFIEDGNLNMDKFKEAIAKELPDWENIGVSDEVKGFSTQKEEKTKDDFSEKEVDDTVKSMLDTTAHVKTKE